MAENPMISFFPLVCGTCGKKLSRVAEAYASFQRNPSLFQTAESEMTPFQQFCESAGISNYCCRMHMLCQPVIVAGTYVPKLPEREFEATVAEPGRFAPVKSRSLITPETVRRQLGEIPEAGLTAEVVTQAASYLRPEQIAAYRAEARVFAKGAGHPPGIEPGVIINPDLLRSLNRLNLQSRNFTSAPAALSILEAKGIGVLPATLPSGPAAPSPKMTPGSLLTRPALPGTTLNKPIPKAAPQLPPPIKPTPQLPPGQLPALQPLVPMKPAAAKLPGLPPPPTVTTTRPFAVKPSAKAAPLPGAGPLPGVGPR